MHRVEVVVDSSAYETWTADEPTAADLRIRVLEAAEAGAAIRLEIQTAMGDDLVHQGTVVLRLGNATTVAVRVLPDDRTGAAMGISR